MKVFGKNVIKEYLNEKNKIKKAYIYKNFNDRNILNQLENIPCEFLSKVELDKIEHTIRHGFFKFMREDKDAKDCRLVDVFGQK